MQDYKSLFYGLFRIGIPWEVCICVCVVSSLLSVVLWYLLTESYKERYIIVVWIASCLFLMLYSTVIGRSPHAEVSMQLIPFWSVGAIQSGLIETMYEKFNNVLFFIPYGFLLALYIKTRMVWNSVKVGILTSIIIEFLQLITRTGTCETDDVICNTLGCMVGALFAVGIVRLCDLLRKRMNKEPAES